MIEGTCSDCRTWSADLSPDAGYDVNLGRIADRPRCRRCHDSLPGRVLAEATPTPSASDLEGWLLP